MRAYQPVAYAICRWAWVTEGRSATEAREVRRNLYSSFERSYWACRCSSSESISAGSTLHTENYIVLTCTSIKSGETKLYITLEEIKPIKESKKRTAQRTSECSPRPNAGLHPTRTIRINKICNLSTCSIIYVYILYVKYMYDYSTHLLLHSISKQLISMNIQSCYHSETSSCACRLRPAQFEDSCAL